MKHSQSLISSRRGFLNQMTLLSGAAVTASILPLSSAMAAVESTWQNSYSTTCTYIDEALGNYPHYSEAIGFGRAHLARNDEQSPLEGLSLL